LVVVRVSLEDLKALLLAWKGVNSHTTFETLAFEGCRVNPSAVNKLLEQLDLHIVQVLLVSTCQTLRGK
jgi:hypothetical protein